MAQSVRQNRQERMDCDLPGDVCQSCPAIYATRDTTGCAAAPLVMSKYLVSYVALGLSREERASILIDHYAYLKERVHGDFFRLIIDGRLELWRQGVGEHLYRTGLAFSGTTHDEGSVFDFRGRSTARYRSRSALNALRI